MPSPTQSNQIQAQAGEPKPTIAQELAWLGNRFSGLLLHGLNPLTHDAFRADTETLYIRVCKEVWHNTIPASSSPSSKQEDDPANYPDPRFKWDGKAVEVRGSVVWFKPADGNGEHGWGQFNPYEAKRLAIFINSAIAPKAQQEDDREWEKRRMPIPTDPDTVAWAERSIAAEAELASLREREMDPRRRLPVVGEVYKEPSGRTAVEVVSVAKGSHSNVYIGRVELSGTTNEIRSPLDNVTLDEWWHWVNRAHLIGFKPPDSKPPTQSEDHIADAGKMVEPTKPTQSVQPWPEDLSVLHNARLRMRSKRFGDRGVIVVKVTGVSDSVYGRMVEDEDCAYPIQNFDLLSVSPPLESKPQSKSSRPMTPEELNDLKEFVAEHPWMSQPQSVQSEGKVRWFKHKTDKNMVWESVGRYGRWHHLDGSIEESGLGIEGFTTDENYEEFFPTQPKDSKEMGEDIRYVTADRDEWKHLAERRLEALKSANERAEAAEKKNIELESKVTEAYTQGVAEGRAAQ